MFFSSDVANPDTYTKFYCDLQMYTTTMGQPDPGRIMRAYCSWEAATKANKWQGRNITRWRSEEYDAAYKASEEELDPVRRAALFIRMNDLAIAANAVIPVVHRPGVSGFGLAVQPHLTGWDATFAHLRDWYREA